MDENRFELFMGLLGSAAKSIQRLKAARMEPFRLSAAHTDCLCQLFGASADGLTQTQLAERLMMDRAQVSRVLRDLLDRAYVACGGAGSAGGASGTGTDGSGGYKSRYRLTDAGQRIAQEIQRIIAEINGFVSGSIPMEDIEGFYRTFKTIASNLSEAVNLYGLPDGSIPNESKEG